MIRSTVHGAVWPAPCTMHYGQFPHAVGTATSTCSPHPCLRQSASSLTSHQSNRSECKKSPYRNPPDRAAKTVVPALAEKSQGCTLHCICLSLPPKHAFRLINRGEQCMHANPACKTPRALLCLALDFRLAHSVTSTSIIITCSQTVLTTIKGQVDVDF